MVLLGHSVESMEAAHGLSRELIAVVPSGFGELHRVVRMARDTRGKVIEWPA